MRVYIRIHICVGSVYIYIQDVYVYYIYRLGYIYRMYVYIYMLIATGV